MSDQKTLVVGAALAIAAAGGWWIYKNSGSGSGASVTKERIGKFVECVLRDANGTIIADKNHIPTAAQIKEFELEDPTTNIPLMATFRACLGQASGQYEKTKIGAINHKDSVWLQCITMGIAWNLSGRFDKVAQKAAAGDFPNAPRYYNKMLAMFPDELQVCPQVQKGCRDALQKLAACAWKQAALETHLEKPVSDGTFKVSTALAELGSACPKVPVDPKLTAKLKAVGQTFCNKELAKGIIGGAKALKAAGCSFNPSQVPTKCQQMTASDLAYMRDYAKHRNRSDTSQAFDMQKWDLQSHGCSADAFESQRAAILAMAQG